MPPDTPTPDAEMILPFRRPEPRDLPVRRLPETGTRFRLRLWMAPVDDPALEEGDAVGDGPRPSVPYEAYAAYMAGLSELMVQPPSPLPGRKMTREGFAQWLASAPMGDVRALLLEMNADTSVFPYRQDQDSDGGERSA
jgi:hypothetical protein